MVLCLISRPFLTKQRFFNTDVGMDFSSQTVLDIKWGRDDVLKKTIDNFSLLNLKHDFLHRKIDIDTISDIEKRK